MRVKAIWGGWRSYELEEVGFIRQLLLWADKMWVDKSLWVGRMRDYKS